MTDYYRLGFEKTAMRAGLNLQQIRSMLGGLYGSVKAKVGNSATATGDQLKSLIKDNTKARLVLAPALAAPFVHEVI